MSRSRRKTPISGVCKADSDKADKVIDQRRYRHAIKQLLHQGVDDDKILLPSYRSFSDPWNWPKDGKSYFGHEVKCGLEEYERIMRK